MKKQPTDIITLIARLSDLSCESAFIARAVLAQDDPEQTGLAVIIERWSAALTEIAEALDGPLKDNARPGWGTREGLRYFVAPADREAPGPFTWIVADDVTSRVAAHGSAESWSEADDAAVAAIQEAEANA
ncbi:hypothetical protein [Allochromatium vinosum]|uniref:hypothetical protein n=1 Tax=Allochromatium vinosum TaxID=1049 RepID=UPI0019039B26|nr:hypothetical protein [Allochromatium vinosum]MBK1656034.1 hypothetical protein [Allochromatium vinosum]